jgi:hypothetical protein
MRIVLRNVLPKNPCQGMNPANSNLMFSPCKGLPDTLPQTVTVQTVPQFRGPSLHLQDVTFLRHHLVEDRTHDPAQEQSRNKPCHNHDGEGLLRIRTDARGERGRQ